MIAPSQSNLGARWDDVRLFLAIHRERTLTGAARSVGLDASTLSRRLVALEELLGGRLFDRTREGLRPTESAELLLPAAEEMAAAHARFSQDASGFEREAEGIVRLSVPPGIAEYFVASALLALRAKYPRIRLDIDASIRFVDLTRREADLAVRTQRPQTGDLVSVKLGERRWIPMLAAKYAKKVGPVKRWEDVPWVGWGDDMQSFAPARWLAKHVPHSAVALRTSQFTVQMAAVEAGTGAALLPALYARMRGLVPLRHARKLTASTDELPINETWLVGHAALRAVPRVAAVWSFLVEEFQKFERGGR